MNPRRFILLTLFAPLCALAAFWLFARLYDPEPAFSNFSTSNRETEFLGPDGARLAGTAALVDAAADLQTPRLLIVSDPTLDRDWNSPALRTHVARRLADRLATESGIESFRFDPRGAGRSAASRSTYRDLELLAGDFASALRVTRALDSRAQGRALAVLAHGEACTSVLYALHIAAANAPPDAEAITQADASAQAAASAIDGLILSGCAFSGGSALEDWGRRLLWNLERSDPPETVRAQAREELNRFLSAGKVAVDVNEGENRTPPDLIAFRAALRYMASPDMKGFAEPARAFFPVQSLERLNQSGLRVLRLTGEFDEEIPADLLAAARSSGQTVPRTDHFLKATDARRQGFALALQRYNPFRTLSPEATAAIRDFLLGLKAARPTSAQSSN